MPALTVATENIRVLQCLKVILLTQQGTTQAEALQAAGLSRDQYSEWVSKEPDLIAQFMQQIQESERRQLADVLSYRERILHNMLEKAVAVGASTLDMLSTLSYLDRRIQELGESIGLVNETELKASDYLKGAKLTKQKSRMTATVTLEEGQEVHLSFGSQDQEDQDFVDTSFAPTPEQSE